MSTINHLDTRRAILDLPLKEMDGTLLAQAIILTTENWVGGDRVRRAVELAAFLHRKATRAERGVMPRDHYVTHPLRNTLRLLRWGISDIKVLVASILHDTVEDCAEEMLALVGLSVPTGHVATVELVLSAVVTPAFGVEVSDILREVTNPETDKALGKEVRQQLYRDHVLKAFTKDKGVLLVKLSDLVDNAGSLHHNVQSSPSMVGKLATKYRPLMEPLRAEVLRQRPFRDDVTGEVLEQIERITERLDTLLAV